MMVATRRYGDTAAWRYGVVVEARQCDVIAAVRQYNVVAAVRQ